MDFSGQNLRGRSFKGQNLEGANFSGADIRGANFTNANLTGANFSYAKAGLQKHWATFLGGVYWLLSGVSGFFSALAGALIPLIFSYSSPDQVTGWTNLIIIIVLFIVILHQGLNSAYAYAYAVAVAIAYALTYALDYTYAYASTVFFAGALAYALAYVLAYVLAYAVACAVVEAEGFVGAVAVAVACAVAVRFVGAYAVAGVLLSAYIAWRAMKGDEKYAIIRNIAVDFAASGGTSFRNANLTDANFTAATLKSTDFRTANLTRTCFNQIKMLDRVRTRKTYLQNALVVSVLVMGVILPNIFSEINHQLVAYLARSHITAINRAEQAFYQERQKDERNNKNFSCDLKAYSKNKNCIETRSARSKASLLQSSPSKGRYLLPSKLEKNNFTSRLEDLELGIRSGTMYYNYSILRADNLQAIATVAAKKDGFKSYIGAVFLVKNADGSSATLTISCETNAPSKTPPVTPEISGNDIQCPSDSHPIRPPE